MRTYSASRGTGQSRRSSRREQTRRGIIASLYIGIVGLFLCGLATAVSIVGGGEWLGLPPDYTMVGWGLRTLGAAIGINILLYFLITQHTYLRRKRRRSFNGRMARIGLVVATACVVWEFVLMGVVLALLCLLLFGLFGRTS